MKKSTLWTLFVITAVLAVICIASGYTTNVNEYLTHRSSAYAGGRWNELFDICVDLLYWVSDLVGLSYKETNIWVFIIIHPLLTISLLFITIRQRLNFKLFKLNNTL